MKVSLWKEDLMVALVFLAWVIAAPLLVLSLERSDPTPDLRILSYTIQQSSPGEQYNFERAPLPLTIPLEKKK